MTASPVLSRDVDGVRIVTVDRPDKLNALNRETIGELTLAFRQAAQDDGVRVVVLAGAGEKAFVAGADISEMTAWSPVQAQAASRAGQDLMLTVERLGKPVIARIHGYALGGGMELAMACHLRVASEKARFGQPEIGLGLIPGFGGTQRLTRLTGRGAALELCLLGHQIDAARAERLGIVTRVVAADELDATVDAMADQLAAAAPLALKGILDAVIEGGECAIDQGLAFETQGFALAFSTEDMHEGTGAFLERRKPSFKGV